MISGHPYSHTRRVLCILKSTYLCVHMLYVHKQTDIIDEYIDHYRQKPIESICKYGSEVAWPFLSTFSYILFDGTSPFVKEIFRGMRRRVATILIIAIAKLKKL